MSVIGALLYFMIVPAKEAISISTYCLLLKTSTVFSAYILKSQGVMDLAQSLEPSLLFHCARPLYWPWLIIKVIVNMRAGYIFFMRRLVAGGHRKPHLHYVLIVHILFLI